MVGFVRMFKVTLLTQTCHRAFTCSAQINKLYSFISFVILINIYLRWPHKMFIVEKNPMAESGAPRGHM